MLFRFAGKSGAVTQFLHEHEQGDDDKQRTADQQKRVVKHFVDHVAL